MLTAKDKPYKFSKQEASHKALKKHEKSNKVTAKVKRSNKDILDQF